MFNSDGPLGVRIIHLRDRVIRCKPEDVLKLDLVGGELVVNSQCAVVDNLSGHYEGGLSGNLFFGRGTFNYTNGDVYRGSWRHGLKYGDGVYFWADGAKYDGAWKDNMLHGYGVLTYSNGGKYIGYWEYGMRHGKGTYVWPNGDVYDGEWQRDVQHGYGVLTYSNGNEYKGEWKDDKRHGLGTFWTTRSAVKFKWKNSDEYTDWHLFPHRNLIKGEWADDYIVGYYLVENEDGQTLLRKNDQDGIGVDLPCTLVANRHSSIGMLTSGGRFVGFPKYYNHQQALEIVAQAEQEGCCEEVQRFCDRVRAYGPRFGSTFLSMC